MSYALYSHPTTSYTLGIPAALHSLIRVTGLFHDLVE